MGRMIYASMLKSSPKRGDKNLFYGRSGSGYSDRKRRKKKESFVRSFVACLCVSL